MSAIEAGVRAPDSPWRDEVRATLTLSWPMVLTNLAQIAMTATDVMMMGHAGAGMLAAGALGSNLYFAPLIFGLGLMNAVAPMMATELGRNRHSVRDIRRTARQGLWIAVLVSIPIWLLLWNAEALLKAMGQQPDLAREAGIYVRWLQWAVLPFYGYLVLRSFVSVLERPRWALVVVVVAVVFNAFANWCLIFGNFGFPRMGIAGSGLATTLSSVVLFLGLVLVVMVDRRFRRFRLFGRFWRSDWPRFVALLRLGLPIAAIVTFEVWIFNAATLLMGLIGPAALAANAIAMQIASITFMVPMGLSQAATVRVGRAFGAGNADGVTRAGWTAFAIGVGFMTLTAATMILVPKPLIAGFIDTADPANAEVVALAVTFLAFAGLFQVFDGAQAVGNGMLRGLHDTKVPMVYGLIGYWGVGLPAGVVLGFPLGFGGAGIWTGLSLGLAVVSMLLLLRWLHRHRRLPSAPPA